MFLVWKIIFKFTGSPVIRINLRNIFLEVIIGSSINDNFILWGFVHQKWVLEIRNSFWGQVRLEHWLWDHTKISFEDPTFVCLRSQPTYTPVSIHNRTKHVQPSGISRNWLWDLTPSIEPKWITGEQLKHTGRSLTITGTRFSSPA